MVRGCGCGGWGVIGARGQKQPLPFASVSALVMFVEEIGGSRSGGVRWTGCSRKASWF